MCANSGRPGGRMRRLKSMDRYEQAEVSWPVDLEAAVARNVRLLREGRGISRQQLGADLVLHGCGMSEATVALMEAGSRQLRLNEVAAIAAYFVVPVESLWQPGGEIPKEHKRVFVVGAAQDDEAEKRAAAYYSQERNERLRDKQSET